jgi:hypothetical protein
VIPLSASWQFLHTCENRIGLRHFFDCALQIVFRTSGMSTTHAKHYSIAIGESHDIASNKQLQFFRPTFVA